ncbi:MAG: hypothetical protein AAB901_01340 [Patescibacteria group bacterium]
MNTNHLKGRTYVDRILLLICFMVPVATFAIGDKLIKEFDELLTHGHPSFGRTIPPLLLIISGIAGALWLIRDRKKRETGNVLTALWYWVIVCVAYGFYYLLTDFG